MSKFASRKDEVVYRAMLNGFVKDEIGSVADIGWHGLVMDFHGKDYIVQEDSQGFVSVTCFPMYFTENGIDYRSAESGNAWVDVYDAYNEAMREEDDWEMIPDEYYDSADQKFGYA